MRIVKKWEFLIMTSNVYVHFLIYISATSSQEQVQILFEATCRKIRTIKILMAAEIHIDFL